MIRWTMSYMKGIPAIYIDGGLYSGIIIFGFLSTYFSSDEAAKYISAVWLFWMKGFFGMWSAWFAGIKMFRSNAYSQHQEDKKVASGQTEIFTKGEITQTVKENSPIVEESKK